MDEGKFCPDCHSSFLEPAGPRTIVCNDCGWEGTDADCVNIEDIDTLDISEIINNSIKDR
jgi:hypothetical protein